MFYADQINRILDHIENNLTEDISYTQMAEMLAVSVYEFRRLFAFIIGVPISDYIRLRRLSSSLFDLQENTKSITEIAAKYRYESPSAFSRAFRDMQGISPSEARRSGTVLKSYPRASLAISVMGMNDISFRLVPMDEMTLYGYTGTSVCDDCCCDDVWEAFYEKGFHDILADGHYRDVLGGNMGQYAAYSNAGDIVRCTIGAIHKEGDEIPAGLDALTIPAALWGVFDFVGASAEQINTAYYKTLVEWLTSSVYERDPSVCNLESFYPYSSDDPTTLNWQIWYPLRKKQSIN